jgi:hypothetical protein
MPLERRDDALGVETEPEQVLIQPREVCAVGDTVRPQPASEGALEELVFRDLAEHLVEHLARELARNAPGRQLALDAMPAASFHESVRAGDGSRGAAVVQSAIPGQALDRGFDGIAGNLAIEQALPQFGRGEFPAREQRESQ